MRRPGAAAPFRSTIRHRCRNHLSPDSRIQAFADLRDAGRSLAAALTVDRHRRQAIVLGIVRGGVPAAFEVARALSLPLDLVLLRTLVQRASGELLRAARVAGTEVADEGCHVLPIDSPERAHVMDALAALGARESVCRGTRPPVRLADRLVLLVDNGMRTGQTMAAAIRAVRRLQPNRIEAAAPVATAAAVALAGAEADAVHCLSIPDSLGNVAMAYRRFDVPDETHVRDLMDQVRLA